MSHDPTSAENPSETSLSLLSALKSDVRKHEAWPRFVDRYGDRIRGWCRHWGLQDADARDVMQNVLLQLSRQMQAFEYDAAKGSFRGWLKTIVWRAWADYLSARSKNVAVPSTLEALNQLDSIQARDDLMRRLDDEAKQEVLEIAIHRVRNRVQKSTFEAFQLMALDGISGADAAQQLGISVASAFASKTRVDKMLADEVARLDGND